MPRVKQNSSTPTTTSESKYSGVVHDVFIIDESSSMGSGSNSKYGAAKRGLINDFQKLQELNEANPEITYTSTLVRFSDSVTTPVFMEPAHSADVKLSTPLRGLTALYQAVGETISRIKRSKDENDKVLIKIFTDGGENASRGKYARPKVLSELIKDVEENHGFTVTFIGTQRDVKHIIDNISIDESNTLSHDNTRESVARSMDVMTQARGTYSKVLEAGGDVSKGFYKSV